MSNEDQDTHANHREMLVLETPSARSNRGNEAGQLFRTPRFFRRVLIGAAVLSGSLVMMLGGDWSEHPGSDTSVQIDPLDKAVTERATMLDPLAQSDDIHQEPATARPGVKAELVAQADPDPEIRQAAFHLKRRETLSDLLKRAGLRNEDSYKALHALGSVADLRRLRPGQRVDLDYTRGSAGARLERIRLRDTFRSAAIVERTEGRFEAQRQPIDTLDLTRMIEGTIDDSLYLAAKRAGLPDKIINDVIRMMSYAVDFQRDIRKGDRFRVYFERAYAPSFGDVEDGRVLHAELTLWRGKFEATLFEEEDGRLDYYDQDGNSLRKTLMVTPVDGARLSSGFGRRKHPILGYTRLHKGLDFAANRGTPVMAAGDGVVERANRWGSFGNYVRIRHGGGYQTAYAHLNGFAPGIRKGSRVQQGDIIGYIGTTGRSTGPHLHYEVHKDGRQVNPLRLDLPTARSLTGPERAGFERVRALVLSDMDGLRDQNALITAQNNQGVPASP